MHKSKTLFLFALFTHSFGLSLELNTACVFSCVVHASGSDSHQRKVNDQSTHLYTWPYFTLVLNTPRPETTVKFTTAASVCLKNNLWRCGCSKNAATNQVCLWNCRNVGRPANSGFHFFLAVSLMATDILMSLTLWTCTLCSFILCIFVHVHTAHAFITLHLTLALLLISCTQTEMHAASCRCVAPRSLEEVRAGMWMGRMCTWYCCSF